MTDSWPTSLLDVSILLPQHTTIALALARACCESGESGLSPVACC